MNTPSRTSSSFSLRTFALGVLVAGLVFGTASFSCVPVAQRLASPLACPRGTVDSAVVSHVTRNAKGSIVTEFELRCIDADGGSIAPSGVGVFGTMVLYGTGLGLLLALAQLLRRKAATSVATLALLVLGGCEVGTLTRDEFAARYPYGGGPMFSTGRAEAAARALEARLGGGQRVTGVSISADTVSFLVLGRGASQNLDVWTYAEEGFRDPTPVQSSEREPVADEAFALRPADLARVTAIVRSAPANVGIADGHVRTVSLSKDGAALEFHVDVESAHRRGSARYDAQGTLIAAQVD